LKKADLGKVQEKLQNIKGDKWDRIVKKDELESEAD